MYRKAGRLFAHHLFSFLLLVEIQSHQYFEKYIFANLSLG